MRPGNSFIVTLIPFLTLACKGAKGQKEVYAIEVSPLTIPSGAEGTLKVRFLGKSGYHWNEEYPAKVRVVDKAGLEMEDGPFGDFEVRNGEAELPIKVRAPEGIKGQRKVKAEADFSVCRKTECRILKGVPVEVEVNVQ